MAERAYERVTWRGHKFDRRTVAAIKELEHRLGKTATIYQGSYNGGGVAASAGTHDGGGAVDLWVSGMDPNTVTRVMRNVGWAAWLRTSDQGPWAPHQHGILRGHDTASTGAKAQVLSYDQGGTGLASGGADRQPYRPDPLPRFSYPRWVLERTLRRRVAELGRSIGALRHRRNKVRNRLDRLS